MPRMLTHTWLCYLLGKNADMAGRLCRRLCHQGCSALTHDTLSQHGSAMQAAKHRAQALRPEQSLEPVNSQPRSVLCICAEVGKQHPDTAKWSSWKCVP